MKVSICALIVGLAAVALSASVSQHQEKFTDKAFLQKQKDVLLFLTHLNQPSYVKEFADIANTYTIKGNYNFYTKPEVAEKFYEVFHYDGFLKRGEIFSIFNDAHQYQAKLLFKLFYYAKDYDTFYKTAAWARQHLNEGLFLYTFSVAIVHREDTHGLILPPIYEVYPYYFHSSEVIERAQFYKQVYQGKEFQHEYPVEKAGDYEAYTVPSNYSGWYLNLHPEQSLSYFTEDIGVNAFNYYASVYFPYFLGGEEFSSFFGDRRGEYFFHFYQQILARYYLERLSNGFGEIEYFNYEVPFQTGYYPSLRYANGLEFPTRPNYANLHEYFYNYGQKWNFQGSFGYSYTRVQDYERRIRDAIDHGFVFTHDGKKIDLFSQQGLNVFGNLVESNPDSPDHKYFGDLQKYARHLLGYSYQAFDQHHVAPSALEHFETSLRDPAFYQLFKRIILYYYKYQQHYNAYTKKDLYFDGVEVTGAEFDRLITFFEPFYSSLTHATYVTKEEFYGENFHVRARQDRLNFKSFTYKVHVKSAQDQEAVVRVFIGPKYDEFGRHINITENRVNFVEFDYFKYSLKSGENVITRNSHELNGYQDDRTSYYTLYKQVLGAINGNGESKIDASQSHFGFPRRFALPRGSFGGTDYQFYFIVTPFVASTVEQASHGYKVDGKHFDNHSLGYPFDRPIYSGRFFHEVPNSYFYSTKVFHRKFEDVNTSTASVHV